MSAKAKPKQRRGRPADLELVTTKPRTGGAILTVLGGGSESTPINRKIPSRPNPAQPDLLKTLPEARQRVFERHYPELAKAEKTHRRKAQNKKAK